MDIDASIGENARFARQSSKSRSWRRQFLPDPFPRQQQSTYRSNSPCVDLSKSAMKFSSLPSPETNSDPGDTTVIAPNSKKRPPGTPHFRWELGVGLGPGWKMRLDVYNGTVQGLSRSPGRISHICTPGHRTSRPCYVPKIPSQWRGFPLGRAAIFDIL